MSVTEARTAGRGRRRGVRRRSPSALSATKPALRQRRCSAAVVGAASSRSGEDLDVNGRRARGRGVLGEVGEAHPQSGMSGRQRRQKRSTKRPCAREHLMASRRATSPRAPGPIQTPTPRGAASSARGTRRHQRTCQARRRCGEAPFAAGSPTAASAITPTAPRGPADGPNFAEGLRPRADSCANDLRPTSGRSSTTVLLCRTS